LINPMFNPGAIDWPGIPIYLAGVNPAMCRAAGEVADGFHVHSFHSRKYLKEVVRGSLDEGARIQGKTVNDLELSCPVFIVTGDTQEAMDAAMEETRRQISFYASTPSYRAVLTFEGLEELGKELSRLVRKGEWDAMAKLITDDVVELFATVAKFTDLPKALHERYDGLLDQISLYYPVAPEDSDEKWTGFIEGLSAA